MQLLKVLNKLKGVNKVTRLLGPQREVTYRRQIDSECTASSYVSLGIYTVSIFDMGPILKPRHCYFDFTRSTSPLMDLR